MRSDSERVVIIAAPLMAKSGVYRTTIDLIRTARAHGHDWNALIGLRETAVGASSEAQGVEERNVVGHGSAVVRELSDWFLESKEVQQADIVITMISQSDIAYARQRRVSNQKWVAWTRGMPWPDKGEQSRARTFVARVIESWALRRADEVWATTPILAEEVARAREPFIVPAGVPAAARLHDGFGPTGELVWAARIDHDKNPSLFLKIARETGLPSAMFGTGPLEAAMREESPSNLRVPGWVDARTLWQRPSIFVGTSLREAFGRSAVEAAMVGTPSVLSDQYGAAPLLYTDPELRERFVLPLEDHEAWVASVRSLVENQALRVRVSEHVYKNAQGQSIDASLASAISRLRSL